MYANPMYQIVYHVGCHPSSRSSRILFHDTFFKTKTKPSTPHAPFPANRQNLHTPAKKCPKNALTSPTKNSPRSNSPYRPNSSPTPSHLLPPSRPRTTTQRTPMHLLCVVVLITTRTLRLPLRRPNPARRRPHPTRTTTRCVPRAKWAFCNRTKVF